MISKGTTHDNGGKLARYLVTGKDGERAELWELRGFASPDIVDAFRSIHVIADATQCQQPFFHVQVRCPEGEALSRDQWEYTANRIERMLGLTDQPRAIAFHVQEKNGEQHMHVAWSRIDEETLTAKKLPYYKERLKKLSREIEAHFGLTLVPNERDSSIKYAPTRAEAEQARRLGLDVHEIRQTIRDCYERSDCGRSFEVALADENLLLARGDRRDFIVVDHAGGVHAVGKRILGVAAAEIREHLADLNRDHLLTVEQAQERAGGLSGGREKKEPVWDRDIEERKWQDALARAAIEKEKVECQFVEPQPVAGKQREEPSPFAPPEPKSPPHPQLNKTAPEFWFGDVARETTRDTTPQAAPDHLKGAAADIWLAYNQSHDGRDFAERLAMEGIVLAAATKEEADRSYREASFARAVGNFAPVYREGEIVAITQTEHVYKMSERTTGDDRAAVEKFLARLDRTDLLGIEATKQVVRERAELHEIERQAFRDLSAVGVLDRDNDPRLGRQNVGQETSAQPIIGAAGKAIETLANLAESAIDMIGDMFGAATPMSPERIQAAVEAKEGSAVQAEIDLKRFRSDADYRRQTEGQEGQRIAEQQRNYYERERNERQR